MERKNLLAILVFLICIIVIFVFFTSKKENRNSKQENINVVDYSNTIIVPSEDSGNPTDVKYDIKTEDGKNIISYEVIDLDEENTIYTIRDSYGREIGNTTNPDEIRVYVENSEYSKYGPTIK